MTVLTNDWQYYGKMSFIPGRRAVDPGSHGDISCKTC